MADGHDDFYSDDDGSISKCNSTSKIWKSIYGTPTVAAISIVCYLYIFYMYFVVKSPVLKRHPTSKFILLLF